MKCPNCGNELKEGNLLCEHCGEEVKIVCVFAMHIGRLPKPSSSSFSICFKAAGANTTSPAP